MSRDDQDVAIVGLGPVGAFTALLLAESGLRVGIYEASREPVVLPRAVGLDGESVRAFQRIGLAEAVTGLLQPPREKDEVCFTDSKRRFLMPLFVIGLSYLVYERRIRVTWVAAGIAFLALLYPVAQFYRDHIHGEGLTAAQVLTNPTLAVRQLSAFVSLFEPGQYIQTGFLQIGQRIDGISAAAVIIRDTPEKVPYQGGWSIGYIFLSYVPRVLWPDKPNLVVGQWVNDNYGPGSHIKAHVGPSWAGELFFNFGHLGVAPGLMIFGIFLRILQELFFRPNAPIPALLVAVAVLAEVLITPGGRLMSPINSIIFNCTPILFIHLFIRNFSRPPPSPSQLEQAHASRPARA